MGQEYNEKVYPVHRPFILHGAWVSAGSSWPILHRQDFWAESKVRSTGSQTWQDSDDWLKAINCRISKYAVQVVKSYCYITCNLHHNLKSFWGTSSGPTTGNVKAQLHQKDNNLLAFPLQLPIWVLTDTFNNRKVTVNHQLWWSLDASTNHEANL
jgi:hypothetical protein